MTNKLAQQARAILKPKITPIQAANIFCDHFIIHYELPDTVLYENGQQFVSKFSIPVYIDLGITKPATTALHQNTNGNFEGYNETLA